MKTWLQSWTDFLFVHTVRRISTAQNLTKYWTNIIFWDPRVQKDPLTLIFRYYTPTAKFTAYLHCMQD